MLIPIYITVKQNQPSEKSSSECVPIFPGTVIPGSSPMLPTALRLFVSSTLVKSTREKHDVYVVVQFYPWYKFVFALNVLFRDLAQGKGIKCMN